MDVFYVLLKDIKTSATLAFKGSWNSYTDNIFFCGKLLVQDPFCATERDFNIFQVLRAAVSAFLFPGTCWVWTDWGMLGNLLGDFWLRKLIFASLGKKKEKKKKNGGIYITSTVLDG